MRARAVVACVDSDAENIFITLTARELRPDIAIVARASAGGVREQAAPRRRRPRDLALQGLSGAEMARLALHPQVSRRARRRARVPAWRRSRSPPGATGVGSASATCAAARSSSACATPDGTFQPQPPAETVLQRRATSSWRWARQRTMERLEDLFAARAAPGTLA